MIFPSLYHGPPDLPARACQVHPAVRRLNIGLHRLRTAAPGMCYWNLQGAWVCECDEAFSWDDYFWGKSYRRKRFTPPDLRAFLLELLCELPDDLSRQAAQEREERARQRATCAERTLSIGTTRPPRPCCPNPLEWLPMAIYI